MRCNLEVIPFSNVGAAAPSEPVTADYLHDESKLAAAGAHSLFRPRTVQELRSTIAKAVNAGQKVTVSGSRTGLAGGAVPQQNNVIIATDRLKSIGPFEGDAIWVEAGVTLAELERYLEQEAPELYFPVDPTETSASFGGMIATNAGGARSFRFGSIRPWVEALEVELSHQKTLCVRRRESKSFHDLRASLGQSSSDGPSELKQIPKPATKNSIGYGYDGEIIDLFIGAEGTLGIVSRALIQLLHKPKHRLFFLQFFQDNENVFRFVETLRTPRRADLHAIEYLDHRSLAFAIGRLPSHRLSVQAHGAAAAVICEFGTEDEIDSLLTFLTDAVEAVGEQIDRSFAGFEEKDLREIKQFRHAVPEGINALISERKVQHPGLHKIATDIAVPDSELRWIYQASREKLEKAHLDFAIFGHIGDNHFHVNILPKDVDELVYAKSLYKELATAVVPRGGAVSAEHGIGTLKKVFLEIQYPEEILEQMRSLRKLFDPFGTFNPGVLI